MAKAVVKEERLRMKKLVTFRIIVLQIMNNATTCQFGKNLARFGKR
jgi:glutathione peroxidase-family protein